jgi:uncharacterized protein YlaI
MILDKKLEVKIAKYNIEHYIKFFDVKLGDIIEIDIELHLQKLSNKKINVQCDLCPEQRYIKFQAYTKNKERNEKFPIYTCDKCSHIKSKETSINRYGVEYYSKSNEHTERVKKTSKEKYGVEHYSKTSDYLTKRNQTNLEKFGYVNPFMDTEKIKTSLNKKYGVDNPSQIDDFRIAANLTTRLTREENGSWIKLVNKSDWELYRLIVRRNTRNNVKLLDWDGTDFYDGSYIKDNFSLSHIDNDYPTIDHKISIYDGFLNNISTHVISSVDNLCWTKRIINITKNKKSHY